MGNRADWEKVAMDDSEDVTRECPLCGGPLGLLGVLGRVEHFLCRDCGAQFAQQRDREGAQP